MTILTATTCLTYVLSFCLGQFFYCFFEGYLWPADIGLHLKLALHSVHNNFQVKLAHARNNCLARFLITLHMQCWVFFQKLLQNYSKFFLISLSFWFNRHGYNRLCKSRR